MCYGTSLSQQKHVFPQLKGVALDEKQVSIPANNGKNTIVAIAFNRNAEDDLKKWLNPIYETFIKKEKSPSNFDLADLYDVNFVFIPMISGFKRIADDFKKGTEKEFWPYIIDTEKTDIKELQKRLGVEDVKIPYFFVLDKDGNVIEIQSGRFEEAKLAKLEEAAE